PDRLGVELPLEAGDEHRLLYDRAIAMPQRRRRRRYSGSSASDALDRDRGLDGRIRLVALEREVLVAETGELADLRVEAHAREGARGARKLLACLGHVVEIKMRVAQREHELGGRE